MFEKIEEIINVVLNFTPMGRSLHSRLAELYCLNNFGFLIEPEDVGRVKANPLSPFRRFGLNFYEAIEFTELFGFVVGAISFGLNRCVSELELKHVDKYLDSKLKDKIEDMLNIKVEKEYEDEDDGED